jgi:hypothetical protein
LSDESSEEIEGKANKFFLQTKNRLFSQACG